jgi:hypothetical protein
MRLAPAFFLSGVAVVALAANSSCGPTPNTGPELTVTFSHIGATTKAATTKASSSGGGGQGGAGGQGGGK